MQVRHDGTLILKLFLTRHLCRNTGQLLTEDVIVWVDEGQLLHHVPLWDEVENLCQLPVLDDGHAPHRVLPLHSVQDDHVAALAGATDPAQAVEVEET